MNKIISDSARTMKKIKTVIQYGVNGRRCDLIAFNLDLDGRLGSCEGHYQRLCYTN